MLIEAVVCMALPRMLGNSFAAMAICAWLWPVFLLGYHRLATTRREYVAGFAALLLGANLRHFGPLGYSFELIMLGIAYTSMLYLFTYAAIMIDSFLCGRGRSFIYTLVFPLAYTTLDMAAGLLQMGMIQSIGYTQVWFTPMVQAAAVIGEYGIDFIVAWTASCVVFLAENGISGTTVRRIWPWAATFAAFMLFGIVRIIVMDTDQDPCIRVAYTTGPELEQDGIVWYSLSYERNVESFSKAAQDASAGGADILVLCEEGYEITFDREAEFLKMIGEKAKEYGMYMLIPLEVRPGDGDGKSDNMAVLYDPDGRQVFKYTKVKLVPIVETGEYMIGTEPPAVTTLDIPGREAKIALTICFDGEHSEFVSQMGKDIDILFNPSWDWPEVTRENTTCVMMRGLEYGVTVFKPTYDGWSKAVDRYGRTIVETHTRDTGYENVLFTELPIEGRTTPYMYIGQYLWVIYVIGLILFGGHRFNELHMKRSKEKNNAS